MLNGFLLKNKIHLTSMKRCTIYPPMGDNVHLFSLRGVRINNLPSISYGTSNPKLTARNEKTKK